MASELDDDGANPSRVRGIFLLPNLVTIAAMFAGFYAIIAALMGRFENAVIAIFVALILDGMDGRIARWTHSESEMGAQLDSLSDMVSFGVAPAMIAYSWSLSVLGKAGWLLSFLYTVCTALRLARFNSQSQNEEKRYFYGLNTPCSAALVASIIWVATSNDVSGITCAIFLGIIIFILALLKVSSIPYRSFKDIDLRNKRVSFMIIMIMVLALVLISLEPPETIFILFSVYALSGPCVFGLNLIKKKLLSRKSKL